MIALQPVTDACRLHGNPRPCPACRTAREPRPRRFLGTPPAGWMPRLESDAQRVERIRSAQEHGEDQRLARAKASARVAAQVEAEEEAAEMVAVHQAIAAERERATGAARAQRDVVMQARGDRVRPLIQPAVRRVGPTIFARLAGVKPNTLRKIRRGGGCTSATEAKLVAAIEGARR